MNSHGGPWEQVIPIAVSNSGYSRCVAVESACLEKFEDTIGIIRRAVLLLIKVKVPAIALCNHSCL